MLFINEVMQTLLMYYDFVEITWPHMMQFSTTLARHILFLEQLHRLEQICKKSRVVCVCKRR
jgi:hypothetical protein